MVIHADKLRWLLWLRWKMFIRNFTRSSGRVSRILGTLFLVLFGLPFIGSIAIGTYFAYRLLPAPANAEVLFLVLAAIYLLWLILPLLEFTVNEGLDLSKLALFPLTRAELMASLVISTLLDIPTLGLFLVFAAVVAGWAFSLPLALLALLVMLVFYIQIVGMSQLILALLMRTLQSRRFRDLSIIFVALFSSSCYIVQYVVTHTVGSANFIDSLKNAAFSPYLQWLPPGMAARSIQQAFVGNWGASFAWLAGLLAVSVLVLYLWQLVVERGLSSPESGGTKRIRQRRPEPVVAAETASVPTGMRERILSSQIFAIALKDLKYFRRDPQLQALLFQSVMSIAILIVVSFANSGRSDRMTSLGPWMVMVAPWFVFLSLYSLSYNILGMERQSLATLFLFPIDPKRILWGKNIVVALIGSIEVTLLVVLSAFLSKQWAMIGPSLAVGLAGVSVVLGVGNFTSVLLPQRMRQIQRGFQTTGNMSSAGGCLRAIMSMVTLLIMMVVLLPVVVALVVPVIFNVQWVWIISIPASIVYGIAFYTVVTVLVAPRMVARVPEILEVVARE